MQQQHGDDDKDDDDGDSITSFQFISFHWLVSCLTTASSSSSPSIDWSLKLPSMTCKFLALSSGKKSHTQNCFSFKFLEHVSGFVLVVRYGAFMWDFILGILSTLWLFIQLKIVEIF